MRIAFIGHKRIPSREGGIEIVVDELATRMAARGEQVVVYNRKGHNVAGEEFDNQSSTSDKPYMYRGVKVIPVTTIDAKGLAALTSSFFATLKAIKARPDVIHYHAEGPCVPLRLACVCSIESGPCERVDVFHVSGRFWSTSACGEKRTPARPAWTSFPS